MVDGHDCECRGLASGRVISARQASVSTKAVFPIQFFRYVAAAIWHTGYAGGLPRAGGTPVSQAEQDLRIDYVEFPAIDIAATKRFYSEVLGLPVDTGRPNIPGIPGFWMDVGDETHTAQIHLMGAVGR